MQAAPGMLLRVELMLMEMRHPVVSSADAGRCIPCISAAAVHRRPARSRHRFMLSVHVFSLITLRSAAMPPRLQQFHWQPAYHRQSILCTFNHRRFILGLQD